MTKKLTWIILLFLLVISCKKKEYTSINEQTLLPNFGNVDLDEVFTKDDSRLENEDSVKKEIEHYYQTIWEGGNLWGGFLVAKGDHIIYENYRGFAQDFHQEAIGKNTPLHLASISKTLTAMATLKLVEAGKLSLDDDLTQFFPKFPYPGVTVKSLLTQRSGLPKYEYFIEQLDPQPFELSKTYLTNQDILTIMTRQQPDAARMPEKGFMYCNTNFALLALIIEKVTETKFPDAMEAMIFQPLKMKNTFIFQEKDIPTAAKSFYARGEKPHPLDRLDLIYGDKNVYSTPRDLLKFSTALYADNFLRKDLKDMIFEPYSNEKPGINNYGIGFRMKIFNEQEKLTYHTGWWHGTNSVFAHLLKSKVTIVAIGNKFSRGPYSALALSALFENFPYETEKLKKAMGEQDSTSVENTDVDSAMVSE